MTLLQLFLHCRSQIHTFGMYVYMVTFMKSMQKREDNIVSDPVLCSRAENPALMSVRSMSTTEKSFYFQALEYREKKIMGGESFPQES